MKTLFESIIDLELKHYSPLVFDEHKSNNPTLKTRVRHKILEDLKFIAAEIPIQDAFIKGSILTKNYTKDADIDIFVQVDVSKIQGDVKDFLKSVWKQIDDTYLDGISHPFQYYITGDRYNFDNTEAAYDVLTNTWLKRTPSKQINLDEYMDDFKKYVQRFSDFSEELRRNMIDYEVLKDIPNDQVRGLKEKLNKELLEINKSIEGLTEVYKDVRDFRKAAFSEDMTPSDIKKYGVKTRLPGNVVFKMIERYHYLDLYKKIRDIIGNDGEISHDEVDQLNRILKTRLTNEKTSFSQVFKGKIKGRKDLQHKARHRQQQNNAGMLGQGERKSINLMPDYQRKSPIKGDRGVDNSKGGSRIIRVPQGSPEAKRLAAKYRIADPRGKKTVAGNQHDNGITIIFEETLQQKIERVKRTLAESKIFLGTSRDKKLVNDIFKSVDFFDQLCNQFGNKFIAGNVQAEYIKESNSYSFHLLDFNLLTESPHVDHPMKNYAPRDNPMFNQKEAKRIMNTSKLVEVYDFHDMPILVYKNIDGNDVSFHFLTSDTNTILADVELKKESDNTYVQKFLYKSKLHGGLGEKYFYPIYKETILKYLKGNTIFSDNVQTPDGFRFWENLLIDHPSQAGVWNNITDSKILYKDIKDIYDYYDEGLLNYQFFINI